MHFPRLRQFFGSLSRIGQPVSSAPHRTARQYWQQCTNSFLTNPEYYETCERVLGRDILPRLGRPAWTLDVGCGSGRFTLPLAKVSDQVDAFDLSQALIDQAQSNARALRIDNVHWWVDDVVDPVRSMRRYDLVSCMGVISTIVDDWAFRRVLSTIHRAVKPGGLILLRDSVSLLPEGQLVDGEQYATRYRNVDSYCQAFEDQGDRLELEVELVTFGTSRNGFFLFRSRG